MKLPAVAVLLCCVLLGLGGCVAAGRTDAEPSRHATVTRDSLEVNVAADRRVAKPGETIRLTVTARNLGRKPIRIDSPTFNPILVVLWRYDTAKGWLRVKEFPTAPLRKYTRWELTSRGQRTFELDLPVKLDWPVLTTLKLSAELSGRPDARPHVFMYIQPK